MATVDFVVIALYFAALIAFAISSGRTHRNVFDYYLAGRKVSWWQSGFSTMATQLGAISFISAPAFVALKEGGGLKWLGYEFGVPIGILIVMVVILPVLHRGGYVSIYEYLEERFDGSTRTLVSILFQLGRGLATAVTVLAGGLVVSTVLPISTVQAIVLIGVITIIYDVLGGMRAVILSDVFQMAIIVLGISICGLTALNIVGWETGWATLSPERLRVVNFGNWGGGAGDAYGFWPLLFGGIFLYASYYGTDQSQVQREMSVGGLKDVRRSLLVNAFGRFPIVLLYCIMGIFVGAVFMLPESLAVVGSKMGMSPEAVTTQLANDPDRMVPMFILTFLPAGIVGLLLVAILSAMMSSLDSAMNSLSAVTMQDFYRRYVKTQASDKHYLIASKIITLFWGVFCVLAAIGFALAGEATRQTTIVLINAVGSLLYGPILAAFLLGMLGRRITAFPVKIGVVLGIAMNILVWQATSVSWLWWNVIGFVTSVTVAIVLSYSQATEGVRLLKSHLLFVPLRLRERWQGSYTSVLVYFVGILIFSYLLHTIT